MVKGTPAHGDCLDGPYPMETLTLEEIMPDYDIRPEEAIDGTPAPLTNSDRAGLVAVVLLDTYVFLKARGCDHDVATTLLTIVGSSPTLLAAIFKE